jgi:ABC-type branched-subunit amino acid transport system substrate-binding protein
MAVANNNLNVSSPILFDFENVNTKQNVTTAIDGANNLYQKGAIGFVGVLSSTVAVAVHDSVLLPHSISLVSGGAIASSLSNSSQFPYFLRTYPSASIESNAIISLLDKHALKQRIALISRPSELNSLSLANQIRNKSVGKMWRVGVDLPLSAIEEENDYHSILSQIKSKKIFVILCFAYNSEITAQILANAYEMGLAGNSSHYQWIVDEYSLTSASFQV